MSPSSPSPATRQQLIAAVEQVMECSGCVMDMDGMMRRLERHFPGVDIGTLIFDPPCGRRLSAEEIVDQGLELRDQRLRGDE